jgi:hypothetical protein
LVRGTGFLFKTAKLAFKERIIFMFKIAGGFFRELDVSPRAWRPFRMARDGFLDNNYSRKSKLFSTITGSFFSSKNSGFESGLESGISNNFGSEPEFVNA